MKKEKKKNSTGMMSLAIKGAKDKFESAEVGFNYGYRACLRTNRRIRSKTQEQLKNDFNQVLDDKINSFESLCVVLEYLLSTRDPHQLEYNKKLLYDIFKGRINNYKVVDHLLDRLYKYY